MQMVPDLHDPTSMKICQLESVVLFLMFFVLKITDIIIEINWMGTVNEWVAIETKCFIAVGGFSVELLAYQVSMVRPANWPRYKCSPIYMYILDLILGWVYTVWHHQSSHLHILLNYLLTQRRYLKIEFYVIHLKNWGENLIIVAL